MCNLHLFKTGEYIRVFSVILRVLQIKCMIKCKAVINTVMNPKYMPNVFSYAIQGTADGLRKFFSVINTINFKEYILKLIQLVITFILS